MSSFWVKNEEGKLHHVVLTSRKVNVNAIATIFRMIPASVRINDVLLGCDEQGLAKVTFPKIRRALTYPRDGTQKITAALVMGEFSMLNSKDADTPVYTGCGLLTASELLCMRLPHLQYFPREIQNNQSQKNISIKGRRPKTVSVWSSFFDDVVDFCQDLCVKKAIYLRPFSGETTCVRKQEDIKLALAAHVYVAVNNWAKETFPGREARLRTNQGDSPCMLDHCAEVGKDVLFPIECEATWHYNFRDPEDVYSNLGLIASWGGSNGSNVLRFLYGYMLVCQKPFGVLTTYEETWFFTRLPPSLLREVLRGGVPDINDYLDDGHLFISPAIFSESLEPTILQAFAYFLQMAICLKDVKLCDDSEDARLCKEEQVQTDVTNISLENVGQSTLLVKHDCKIAVQQQDLERSLPNGRSRQILQNTCRVRGKQKRQGPEHGDHQQKSGLPEYSLNDFRLGRLVMSGNGKTTFHGFWGGNPVMVKILDNYKYPASDVLLRHEVFIYKHLSNAQGQDVPRLICFGQIGGEILCVLAISFEGTSLANIICTPKVTVAALKSLSQIHAAGVLHGDIHLGNIVVRDAESSCPSVKFVEFGLACIMHEHYAAMKEEEAQLQQLLS